MSRIHRIPALGLSHRGFRIKPTLNQKFEPTSGGVERTLSNFAWSPGTQTLPECRLNKTTHHQEKLSGLLTRMEELATLLHPTTLEGGLMAVIGMLSYLTMLKMDKSRRSLAGNICDRYPFEVQIKGGFVLWKSKVIVFTSNYHGNSLARNHRMGFNSIYTLQRRKWRKYRSYRIIIYKIARI